MSRLQKCQGCVGGQAYAHDQEIFLALLEMTTIHRPSRKRAVLNPQCGANYVYSVAKPDGLTLATFNAALYFEQLIGRKEAQFDWQKMTWVGSSTPTTRLFYIRADSPYATIADLRKAADPPKCGTTGRGTTGYMLPKLFEESLGLKLAIVSGYPGGGEVDLAIEKGEIQCNSTSLSVYFGREPFDSWRRKNFVRVLIQTGRKRDGRLPDVPTIYELMDQYKTAEANRRLTAVFLDAGRFGSWPSSRRREFPPSGQEFSVTLL